MPVVRIHSFPYFPVLCFSPFLFSGMLKHGLKQLILKNFVFLFASGLGSNLSELRALCSLFSFFENFFVVCISEIAAQNVGSSSLHDKNYRSR